MFAQSAIALVTFLGWVGAQQIDTAPTSSVQVEHASDKVVVTIAPLRIPKATHYHHDGPDAHAQFHWPKDGWVQGYEIDLIDSEGRTLPKEMLHHVGVANLTRRQFAYAKAERLFAVGRETEKVQLPSWMGVRMSEDQPLLVYFALVNPIDAPIEGVALRMSFDWKSSDSEDGTVDHGRFYPRRFHPVSRHRTGSAEITDVVPLVLNANPKVAGSSLFDVPAGRSVTSAEFTLPGAGQVRAMGAHLHDHAVEIRLEEVATGEVIVRLETDRDAEGRLLAIEQTRFGFGLGALRLDADRRYRVVGVYDNPTGETIPSGAMAYMAGIFIPDDPTDWPELDPDDPVYRSDISRMMGGIEPAHEHAEYADR